jgi:hypothetical protein
LIDDLARITGVNIGVLQHTKPLSTVAVAQKMSWAARRQTSRIEDAAYCLLGIFDVNMAMLYGEEGNAFRRLQEEIIRTTPDHSIFAWTSPPSSQTAQSPKIRVFSGILAASPLHFSKCGSVVMLDQVDIRTDFSVSNQGIKMRSQLQLEPIAGERGYRYIFPVCFSETQTRLGIRLRKCGASQFLREDPVTLVFLNDTFWENVPRRIYLLTQLPEDRSMLQTRPFVLQIRLPPEMEVGDIWRWAGWDDEDQIFFLSRFDGRDCGAAKIRGVLNLSIQGRSVPFSFTSIFYALGWAQLENRQDRQLKCTVVDFKLLDPALHREMTESLEGRYHPTSRVIRKVGVP